MFGFNESVKRCAEWVCSSWLECTTDVLRETVWVFRAWGSLSRVWSKLSVSKRFFCGIFLGKVSNLAFIWTYDHLYIPAHPRVDMVRRSMGITFDASPTPRRLQVGFLLWGISGSLIYSLCTVSARQKANAWNMLKGCDSEGCCLTS